MNKGIRHWFGSGTPWVWLNAAAVSASLLMVVGLLLMIAIRGLGHFWPADVLMADHIKNNTTSRIIGEQVEYELVPAERLRDAGIDVPAEVTHIRRDLIKTGNRDIQGLDFRWLSETNLSNQQYPESVVVLERREWGNFYGFLKAVYENDKQVSSGEANTWQTMHERLQRAEDLAEQISDIEKSEIGAINAALERLRLEQRRLELDGELDEAALADINEQTQVLNKDYEALQGKLLQLYQAIRRDSIEMEIMDGSSVRLPMEKIIRAYRPNAMGVFGKTGFYFSKIWEFVSEEPREANTEGGIFPAIFGTVMMVLLMSVLVTPFGVIAAVYLREYAKQGPLTRLIRIAVNNLAGVPSIVYGVFGLGFFVYFLGGNIDQLFFPESLPAPTFGTPGIMWAAFTLAILTVPVVIVATEEGLSRIPRSIREGSLALGATKAETLWRTVLPMASPAMMTGMILAIARAAGEVAPLMLVGVVKLAPSLPLDGNFPFLHLDRKFMHLGFHIYDVGFQSPNVEASRPLVYATALLLVLVIVALNLTAIMVRNRLREKYRALEG